MRSRSTFVVAALLLCGASTAGLYVLPEIERVPVDRVLANLVREVDAQPRNVELLINLARVHAMAFARRSDTVEMARMSKAQPQKPWFGRQPEYIQFDVVGSPDAASRDARAHLDEAIRWYRQAVSLAPGNLTARLGLGWALAQRGDRAEAIEQLRAVTKEAYALDRVDQMGFIDTRSRTEEAARYLIPLLDSVADAAEVARLRAWSKEIQSRRRMITPIAVPLRDRLDVRAIVDDGAAVAFDADGSGIVRRWSWITPDAAWLVFDHDGRGRIDSALQLFGSVTFWLFWNNGYHALRSLDDDGDGEISGRELPGLALWHDRNSNGVSDGGEVRPVGDWAIVALSTRYEFDATHPDEIAWSPRGVTFAGGRTRPTYDVILHTTANEVAR
jgi:hypothetical protein